jgi:hypothetical protein
LAELRETLPTTPALSTPGGRSAGWASPKKKYTPTNSGADVAAAPAPAGWLRLRDPRQYVLVDESGVTTDLLRLRDYTP